MKINIEDEIYPEQLRKIQKPPKQLHLEGNIELLKQPGIAIIGSRNCTKYGEKIAEEFSKKLAEYGIVIISGMAKGIDSFAHLGTISGKGSTIAVLPSGINHIYPKENKNLYKKIIENGGLIVTEYDKQQQADSNKFLERNRIVSGLSIGILVVEGGYRSGTSVTARLAKKQGKDIFCIPSSLENSKGITPNELIKQGAFLVTEVQDIINKYPKLNLKKQKVSIEKIEDIEIKDEYKTIYNILEQKKEIHINEISKKSKLSIDEINYKLMLLELEDKIISLPGNNYKRK